MNPADIKAISDETGYRLYYRGRSIGTGGRNYKAGKSRYWKNIDRHLQENRRAADCLVQQIVAGNPPNHIFQAILKVEREIKAC